MNIFVLTSTSGSTNTIRPEAELFIGFARRGHAVTVGTQPNTPYAGIFRKEGIRIVDCLPTKKISIDSIRKTRGELRRLHYDILFLTNSKTIPNGAFAAIGFDTSVVTYRGTTGGLYRRDPSAYLTHLHPRVDGIVCVSEAVRTDVARAVWKNRENVVVIHKGHDIAWYENAPADLGEFGITCVDFPVVCVANARPSKGIPFLLQAFDQLWDIANLHLVLVGMNMEGYLPLIKSSRMAGRIHLAGYRANAPEIIAACKLLVQPSISGEGLPKTVMEAIGYGIPCIVTETGGAKEVVEDGRSGFVVPVRDPGAIAERVRRLHGDPELLDAMSKRCRERIRADFSCERSIELYLRYFESLIERGRRA
jgi:L-malate glycosyltransferase